MLRAAFRCVRMHERWVARRTFATRLGQIGIALHVVERLLSHGSLSPGRAHLNQSSLSRRNARRHQRMGIASFENHQGASMPRSPKDKLIFCGHIGCALICIILACLVVVEAKQYFYQNNTDISAISRRH